MADRVRRLAEHLSTMETGWRQLAVPIAAALFTALGATAYGVEQPAYGAGFFALAVMMLIANGWARWYLRTHRRPGSYVGEDGPELLDPRPLGVAGAVITAESLNLVQSYLERGQSIAELEQERDHLLEEMRRGHATRDRVAEVLSIRAMAYRDGVAGEDVSAADTMEWAARELTGVESPPRLLAPGGPVSPEQIEILRRRLAEMPCRPIWLPSNATPESSPASTDFPGVEVGEFHSPKDGGQ